MPTNFPDVNWNTDSIGLNKFSSADMDELVDTSKSLASQQAYADSVAKLAAVKTAKKCEECGKEPCECKEEAKEKKASLEEVLAKFASTKEGAEVVKQVYQNGAAKAAEDLKKSATK